MNLVYLLMAFSILSAPFSIEGHGSYPDKFEGLFQEYEKHPLDLIARFIPAEPVIFEGGAHYGLDTVKIVKKWPASRIISFEPNPHAFQLFLEATKGMHNVEGHNVALNNYNGTATLYVCYGTTGDNPIYEGASSLLVASADMEIHYQGPQVQVPCVILDDWCKENDVDHIDFMWIDLEGLELQILKASPEILSTVKVIYTETNFYPFRVGMTRYDELKEFLEKSGFILLSHWFMEGLQGNAIFLRNDIPVKMYGLKSK